jgi:hypothetical protein
LISSLEAFIRGLCLSNRKKDAVLAKVRNPHTGHFNFSLIKPSC